MALRRLAVVSDLHCGSIYGLLPPNFINSDGVNVGMNAGQAYLWDCWIDFTDRLKEFKPELLIVNGDCVDGSQRIQHGIELSLPLMFDQNRAASMTLRVIKKKCPNIKFYFTQGTTYHVSAAAEQEEHIARDIGAIRYPSIGTGRYVREVLWLDIDGVIIEASHHVGGASGFYRLTAIDREMQWSAMAAKDNSKGVPKADLLIRSHVHNFQAAEHASKQGVITPCWQLQTKYARKNSVYRLLPDIGGVLIEVDGQAKKKGRPPCRIIKELYSLPPIEVVKVDQV